LPSEALIDVTRVSKCFERGVRVLDDITFSVVGPMTGQLATIGDQFKQGAQAAAAADIS